MAVTADKINRERFHTTLDTELIFKARILAALLKRKGKSLNGVNEIIEEGLTLVFEEYSDVLCEYDLARPKRKRA